MHEIIFKGKQIHSKEWIEGYYFKHDSVKTCLSSDDPKTKHLIGFDGFCDWGFEPPLQFVEIIPETLCRYTGLPDVSNQPIFEGDVVESRASENPEDWKRWLVSWQDGAFWFSTEPKKKRKRTYCLEDTLCEDNIAFYGLVVIGNIHDNPELIKEDAHGTNGV